MTAKRHSFAGRILAVATLLMIVIAGAPAGAQEDPYGPTTTTTEGPVTLVPSCHFEIEAGLPGATALLTVTNVPLGGTVIVQVGGEEAGRATADVVAQAVGPAVGLGGVSLPAQATTTDLVVPFTVPELPAGVYQVTAVGADFSIQCAADGFEVLGGSQVKGGSGSLPRTGMYVLAFLVLAAALILLGRAFLRASRERREAREREARRAARRAARAAEEQHLTK